jgi:hypothetical protein
VPLVLYDSCFPSLKNYACAGNHVNTDQSATPGSTGHIDVCGREKSLRCRVTGSLSLLCDCQVRGRAYDVPARTGPHQQAC